jgi:hypothetical protein
MRRTRSLVVALALAACGGPTLENPWRAPSGNADPTCQTGCTEIGTFTDPHLGEITIFENALLDDKHAQFGRCVGAYIGCTKDGGELPDCVASSPCPGPCKDEYRRILAGAADRAAQHAAFDAVFLADDAPCWPGDLPETGGEVMP